ncbi:MAG: NlpC/P60 family protein [Verrucomicrobiae bacterium]|nr:NlpC/P60 family protein [Verrucomicrobiae bacterium]
MNPLTATVILGLLPVMGGAAPCLRAQGPAEVSPVPLEPFLSPTVPSTNAPPSVTTETTPPPVPPETVASTNITLPQNVPEPGAMPPVRTRPVLTTYPISPSDLREFDTQPAAIRDLIETCLRLTDRRLDYEYGSADPKNGGMDCSGFVHYVLRQQGIEKVPRQANEFYLWVRKIRNFQAVLSHNPKTPELDDLRPGDLLFWTGTYDVKRDPPVTHVMIYLGRLKKDGTRVMAGASEGRRFLGKVTEGVTVFDFEIPKPGRGNGQFVGYSSIPGLTKTGVRGGEHPKSPQATKASPGQ